MAGSIESIEVAGLLDEREAAWRRELQHQRRERRKERELHALIKRGTFLAKACVSASLILPFLIMMTRVDRLDQYAGGKGIAWKIMVFASPVIISFTLTFYVLVGIFLRGQYDVSRMTILGMRPGPLDRLHAKYSAARRILLAASVILPTSALCVYGAELNPLVQGRGAFFILAAIILGTWRAAKRFDRRIMWRRYQKKRDALWRRERDREFLKKGRQAQEKIPAASRTAEASAPFVRVSLTAAAR